MYLSYHHHHKFHCLCGFPWLSLSIHPYHPSIPTGPLNSILCPHWAVIGKFLLIGQHWLVRVKGSIGEHHYVPAYLAVSYMLCLSCLDGFSDGRWVVIQLLFPGVLLSGFVQCKNVAFSQHILFGSMWCIYRVIFTQPLLWRNPILSDASNFHMISSWFIAVQTFTRQILTSLSVDGTLLPSYVNLTTNFRGPPFRLEMVLSWLKHMYLVLFAFM